MQLLFWYFLCFFLCVCSSCITCNCKIHPCLSLISKAKTQFTFFLVIYLKTTTNPVGATIFNPVTKKTTSYKCISNIWYCMILIWTKLLWYPAFSNRWNNDKIYVKTYLNAVCTVCGGTWGATLPKTFFMSSSVRNPLPTVKTNTCTMW